MNKRQRIEEENNRKLVVILAFAALLLFALLWYSHQSALSKRQEQSLFEQKTKQTRLVETSE